MKHTILTSVCILIIAACSAQKIDSSKVGTMEYYEGKVMLGVGSSWTKAKINADIKKHQSIRTLGDAMAEITWNNGVTSVVGPESNILVSSLLDGSTSSAKNQTKGSFDNFKRIFSDSDSDSRTQEGGIRRAEAPKRDKPARDQIYWKQDPEVHFDEAFALYESGEYKQAIKGLQTFLYQKPQDEQAKFAYFALGHCYIMSNNTVKAKSIFDRFILQYPDDPLTEEAKTIVSEL
jgi:TolA-binding protein